ncbi:MAG: response regulator transcription factor, partial [Pseudomonadota bacterium]
VRELRAEGASLPILMLSALSEVEHRAAGLEAGADDYVVKPFSFDELVARLKVQEHRAPASRPAPAQMSETDRQLRTDQTFVTLTEREYALLALLVQHAGEPLTRGALYDALWQAEGASNENVVDVYIGYLRKKLTGHDFGFEIKTIRNKGFCLEGRLPEVTAP